MPFGDGTGPRGLGPGTGRGRGWCLTGIKTGGHGIMPFRGRKRWLFGLAVPIIAGILRDLANPKGIIHQACAAFLQKNGTVGAGRLKKTADFSVVEQNPGQSDKREKIS